MTDVVIDGESLTIEDVVRVARGDAGVALASSAIPKVERARAYVDRLLADRAVVLSEDHRVVAGLLGMAGLISVGAVEDRAQIAFPQGHQGSPQDQRPR